jgi:DDE superfamily endonuclease
MWCIPPLTSAEFVSAMEDVLGVYERPYDPRYPQVCVDETNKQLIGEARDPLPATPGHCRKYDSEYIRNGTANLFIATEPLAGWRHVQVTDTRKRTDFAMFVRDMVDGRYKDAIKVVLVMDNLNTHSIASLYEAFEPAEAKRIAEKLEIHYTPKHGSWLNMAEIELSVLGRQCLDQRIPDKAMLVSEVDEWERARNAAGLRIDWQFTTADARIKLKRLYPVHA